MSFNSLNNELDPLGVFLCHNQKDKQEVRNIADILKRHGIKPWLDERDIDLGRDWEAELNIQLATTKLALIFIGNNGIGDYQDKEIRALINGKDERKIDIIPVFLSSAQPSQEWPNEISRFQGVDFRKKYPPPLQQLLTNIIGESHPLRIFKHCEDSQMQDQRNDLKILLERVKEFWVDRKLTSSLYNEVSISVGKTVVNDMVKYNHNSFSALSSKDNQVELEISIQYVLDVSKYLLILGEPGSGKTTTLLELAQSLSARADAHANEYVPVVLDLSHWQKSQSLYDWMKGTLAQMHREEEKRIGNWLDKRYLIPLLDGLDDTRSNQLECIKAINTFIEKHEPPALVVCSRFQDYVDLLSSLREKKEDSIEFELNGAIRLELLGQQQIDLYLEKLGPESQRIEAAINADANLQELAQYPLMLSIMGKVYQANRPEPIFNPTQTLAERRTQLFEAYVDWAFDYKEPKEQIFPQANVLFWLSWLAKKMIAYQPAYFLIENIQSNWLDSWQQRLAYQGIAALGFSILLGLMNMFILTLANAVQREPISWSAYGLVIALFVSLILGSGSALRNGFVSVLIYSIIGVLKNSSSNLAHWIGNAQDLENWIGDGIYLALIVAVGIGTLNKIKTIETMNWSWKMFLKTFLRMFILGWLVGGLFSGLMYAGHGLKDALPFGLLLGFLFALLAGLMSGLIKGVTDEIREGKIKPNEGMILTLKNGLVVFLGSALVIGLVEWSIYVLSGFKLEALAIGLILGLQLGLVIGLRFGLAAVIKHYSLRLALCYYGCTPFKLIPFLDYCDKLILLNKGAGSYSFLHSSFRDYFAKLELPANNSTETSQHHQ